ncbi:MAG: alcohol dehydrogenase catalytic domain-containing protein, partial [Bacteroidales bacterium]|nr:alcohol dehydrogenase catalytic domain-containing protein [Bacteroidales bacterium]
GDRVTADINMSCGTCYYCIRGDQLLCNSFTQLGIHTDGTFAVNLFTAGFRDFF